MDLNNNIPPDFLNLLKNADAKMDIPAGYFEQFSDHLAEKIQLEDFIATLPKTNVYQVPDNYFEQFSVQTSTTSIKAKRTFVFAKKMGIAASLALVLVLGYLSFNKKTIPEQVAITTPKSTPTTPINFDCPKEEVINYISANLDEFDAESLATDSISISANQLPSLSKDEMNEVLQSIDVEELL
jgi:hypothetical protein